MFQKLLKMLKSLELEEQILNTGVLLCALGVCFPWFGGQLYGSSQVFSGFGYYTGFIGWVVFLIQLLVLFITFAPLLGGPVLVRKSLRNQVRLMLCSASGILLVAAFSVLLKATLEFAATEIRWGIYLSIIGSGLAILYAYLRYQEQLRSQVHELFHHPDEQVVEKKLLPTPAEEETKFIPPPPPPPPPPMEDHSLFTSKP